MRESIIPDERMAVTLQFLTTGETFKSLEYSFRISRTDILSSRNKPLIKSWVQTI